MPTKPYIPATVEGLKADHAALLLVVDEKDRRIAELEAENQRLRGILNDSIRTGDA